MPTSKAGKWSLTKALIVDALGTFLPYGLSENSFWFLLEQIRYPQARKVCTTSIRTWWGNATSTATCTAGGLIPTDSDNACSFGLAVSLQKGLQSCRKSLAPFALFGWPLASPHFCAKKRCVRLRLQLFLGFSRVQTSAASVVNFASSWSWCRRFWWKWGSVEGEVEETPDRLYWWWFILGSLKCIGWGFSQLDFPKVSLTSQQKKMSPCPLVAQAATCLSLSWIVTLTLPSIFRSQQGLWSSVLKKT